MKCLGGNLIRLCMCVKGRCVYTHTYIHTHTFTHISVKHSSYMFYVCIYKYIYLCLRLCCGQESCQEQSNFNLECRKRQGPRTGAQPSLLPMNHSPRTRINADISSGASSSSLAPPGRIPSLPAPPGPLSSLPPLPFPAG